MGNALPAGFLNPAHKHRPSVATEPAFQKTESGITKQN